MTDHAKALADALCALVEWSYGLSLAHKMPVQVNAAKKALAAYDAHLAEAATRYHIKTCNSHRGTQYPCDCPFPTKAATLSRAPQPDTVTEAIRHTASQGTYDEMAIRKAVSFGLAELIVAERAALAARGKAG